MKISLSNATPWVTIFLCSITVVYALIGGAVVIWGHPGALSFDEYTKFLIGFAGALGLLGIGRGISSSTKPPGGAGSG